MVNSIDWFCIYFVVCLIVCRPIVSLAVCHRHEIRHNGEIYTPHASGGAMVGDHR